MRRHKNLDRLITLRVVGAGDDGHDIFGDFRQPTVLYQGRVWASLVMATIAPWEDYGDKGPAFSYRIRYMPVLADLYSNIRESVKVTDEHGNTYPVQAIREAPDNRRRYQYLDIGAAT